MDRLRVKCLHIPIFVKQWLCEKVCIFGSFYQQTEKPFIFTFAEYPKTISYEFKIQVKYRLGVQDGRNAF